MFKRPWSKEAERVFEQIHKYGRAYTHNNPRLPREFGMKCKDIINNDYLDVTTVRNKKQRRTWFITPPDITVTKRSHKRGFSYHFKRKI